MKICVVSSPIFAVGSSGLVGYGGLEQIAWLQARGLAAKGHQVALIAPEGSSCPGVTMITPGPAGTSDEKSFYAKYWQHLLQFDAICDHSWQKWSLNLKIEGRLKTPILNWCHAPVNTMFQSLPPVEKPCFVCISEDQRNHFEALFSRPARTCCNGVDLDYYKPLDLLRSKRFLFLARFSTIKGPDLAIEACRKAEVGLDLIGDTSITNEPEFFEKCKRACDYYPATSYGGMATRTNAQTGDSSIRLIGPASRGECVWWYSQAQALLHPNQRFREPLGLAPLESQACQTPCIAWAYGAMKETIKHGETGFLVNSLDEMIELIKTKAIDTINRQACRDWVIANFSLQRMLDRVEALCQEAVETGGW